MGLVKEERKSPTREERCPNVCVRNGVICTPYRRVSVKREEGECGRGQCGEVVVVGQRREERGGAACGAERQGKEWQ